MTAGRHTKPAVLVLLLAAALLAVVLAARVFAPAEVRAHPCATDSNVQVHEDFHGGPCGEPGHDSPHEWVNEVDGGRDRELEFRVYPPDNIGTYLGANDQIRITLSEFDLSDVDSSDLAQKIKLDDSDDGTEVTPMASVSGQIVTLSLDADTDLANGPGEYLTITFEKATGILTPETPSGFESESEGYEVGITFVDSENGSFKSADKNIVVVKNPVSSTVPNARVRIELATHAEASISGSEEITVDFSGPSADSEFNLPSTITKTRISIRPAGKSSFSPSDVLVQGARVNLTLPEDKGVAAGDYTISFSQLANIRNPFAAGNRFIRINAFVPGYVEDVITAVILRTTTVSPQEGPRGSEFTLEGKGYAQGTVTVFDGDDDDIDPGETLASVKTSRGSFRFKIEARGKAGISPYKVRTRDSNGAIHFAEFDIRSSMAFEPATVGVGDTLNVTIFDWEDRHQEVAAVHIGGVEAWTAEPFEYDGCIEYKGAAHFADGQGEVSFKVNVPKGVPPGEQTVAVYGHEALSHSYKVADGGRPLAKKPCADEQEQGPPKGSSTGRRVITRVVQGSGALVEKTVEVVAKPLTITPSTAVRGQRVTISGAGFSQGPGYDLVSITIAGVDVNEDPSQLEVSHDGRVSVTVTVPLNVRIGENEVQVTGWDETLGTGTLTVPEPSITLAPAEGRAGDRVAVTGSGFVANQFVRLTYGDEFSGGGLAYGRGGFSLPITVPLTAGIGRTYTVTAVMDVEGLAASPMMAGADHSVSPATVTVTPEWVQPGGRMTIRGENLPPLATVRPVSLGDRDITPVPNITTTRRGSFELEVTVPHLPLGDHTLRVEVLGVVVTQVVEVADPPLSGPTEDVFRELIQAGVLVRVWYLDSATQSWSYYDPRPEFAGLSTLTEVKSLDLVWVNLSSPREFQGAALSSGWQIIRIN